MKLSLNHLAALALVCGTAVIITALVRLEGEALAAGLAAGGGVVAIAGTISGRPPSAKG